MSDTVLVVLIITVAVVIVLYVFRNQLSRFFIKANQEGIEAELQTRDSSSAGGGAGGSTGKSAGVNISRNVQAGKGNVIEVGRSNANVSENKQLGEENVIRARTEEPKKKSSG